MSELTLALMGKVSQKLGGTLRIHKKSAKVVAGSLEMCLKNTKNGFPEFSHNISEENLSRVDARFDFYDLVKSIN